MNARPLLYTDVPQNVEHLPFGEARWCVGPATTAHQFRWLYGNQVCRLSDPPESRTFYLVTQKGQPLRASAKLFLEDLRGHLRPYRGRSDFLASLAIGAQIC